MQYWAEHFDFKRLYTFCMFNCYEVGMMINLQRLITVSFECWGWVEYYGGWKASLYTFSILWNIMDGFSLYYNSIPRGSDNNI